MTMIGDLEKEACDDRVLDSCEQPGSGCHHLGWLPDEAQEQLEVLV